jgi:hypothetical protein
MPRVHRVMLVPQGLQPPAHDTGGKLTNLHVKAMAVVFGAQHLKPADPSNPAYVLALERVIACLQTARAGWLAVRTEVMPAGDKECAGKYAIALAGFALELDRLGDAVRWLSKARKELGPAHEGTIAQNLDYVLTHVDHVHNTALVRDVWDTWLEFMGSEFRKRVG